LKIINHKVFKGRNIYCHRRCIRMSVDMEGLENALSCQIEGFNETLLKLAPEIVEYERSLGEEMDLIKVLTEGASLHHICGQIAVTLQNIIGLDVNYCSEGKSGLSNYYFVYEYKYKDTGIEAGKTALDVVNSMLQKQPVNLEYKIEHLKKILETEVLSDMPEEVEKNNIPIIAITGTNGKTTTTRLIAHTLSKAGYKVGMTTTDGIYIKESCIYEGDTTGPVSAMTVLSNNDVDIAVLETARGGMVRDGLAYDLADVGVITNVSDDHLGLDGIETLQDLAGVKALVGEAVKPCGYVVINGDNNMTPYILHRFKSSLIVFSEDKNNEILIRSIKAGGYGIYVDNGILYIESIKCIMPLAPIEEIGITLGGALKYNIQNAMAACGALVGFGIDPGIIRLGLKSFQCNEEMNPGRFNVFDINGIMTILDYGHNIDGYTSVLKGLSAINHRRLIGVIGVPGDRLDRTTFEVGKISGSYFDHIFIKEDKDKRGRKPGEIAELLKKGVLASGFNVSNIKIVLSEEEALKEALSVSEPGDIVIVFFEEYAPVLKIVKERIGDTTPELISV
jgi:cyanophycin synthetase